MTEYLSGSYGAGPPGSGVPPDFVRVADALAPGIEQKLGYFGHARFVAIGYEPRMDAVMWWDGRSSGLAYGASFTSVEEIAPLPQLQAVTFLHPGPHVLVIDRVRRQSYYAGLASAERLLARQ